MAVGKKRQKRGKCTRLKKTARVPQSGLSPKLLFSARQQLSLSLCRCAVQKVGPQSTPWDVIPIEISRRPTVWKAHFEAAAQGNGFVLAVIPSRLGRRIFSQKGPGDWAGAEGLAR